MSTAYRAIRSSKLQRSVLARVTVLDAALVIGRDSRGRPFALRDATPQRGASQPYGWRFDALTGDCRFVPTPMEARPPEARRVDGALVPAEERDGFVWVYL